MRKIGVRIGIVGATGKVGQAFLSLMKERKTPVKELALFGSKKRSKKIHFGKNKFSINTLKKGCFKNLDLVFFSAGEDVSKKWASEAIKSGAFVIDNSAAFRQSHKLIVPEINGHLLQSKKAEIIANPNCSTIQLVMVLHPLNKKMKIDSVKVASYQSVSGYGIQAEEELLKQMRSYLKTKKVGKPSVFPHPIAFNTIPQIGSFNKKGLCTEEEKILRETRKILQTPYLKVSPFTVRVPSLNGHAEVSWVTFKKKVQKRQILNCLKNFKGVKVFEKDSLYPVVSQVDGKDPVYVGRIHPDPSDNKTWLFWIVSDNLRKGAALNSLQIAERLFYLR